MKLRLPGLVLLCFSTAGIWASGTREDPGPGLYAHITTVKGTMVFKLDYNNTPLTVTSFAGLAQGVLNNSARNKGVPYYDGMPIDSIVRDYAVFIGEHGESLPREMTGRISASSPGVLVMDGLSTESSASRFFITIHGDEFLDSKYTSFGEIVSGESTLKRLKAGDIIQSIEILKTGSEARAFPITQDSFDRLLLKGRTTEVNNLEAIDPALAEIVHSLGEGRKKSRSGIYYSVLTEGEGPAPSSGDRVSMHYIGSLLDGTVFDDSRIRDQTFDFTMGVDSMIPGWIEMVMSMKAGEIRKVVLPPETAYGESGFGPIGPNSWLIFQLELVSFIED